MFQAMAVSRFYVAQRWCGASIPVNMLRAGDLRPLQPLDTTAPQAAHMLHELRSLSYSITLGWRCEPHAELDETVYDAVLGLAGDDEDGAMADDDIYDFQRWLRGLGVMWTSELLRADGWTLRARFAADLMRRAQDYEADALRRCNIAFGRGRTSPGPRRGTVGSSKPEMKRRTGA